MMKRVTCVAVLGLAIAGTGAGCEKAKSNDDQGMGHPTKSTGDVPLIHDLPAGNQLLFSGNFLKLQKWFLDTPLAKLASQLNSQTPGGDAWQKCFLEGPGIEMTGALAVSGSAIELRYAMKGMTIDGVEACAKRASFPESRDPDGKFVAIEMSNPGAAIKTGYLQLPDGALYTRISVSLAGGLGDLSKMFPQVTRKMLEDDVAAAQRASAADDAILMSAVAKVDRTKPMWLVATGAGTPIADKVGLVTATLDVSSGFGIDMTAHILDPAISSRVMDGFGKLKTQAAMFGPEAKQLVDEAKLDRDGDAIRLQLTITNAQIEALTAKLQPLMAH